MSPFDVYKYSIAEIEPNVKFREGKMMMFFISVFVIFLNSI